MTTPNLNPALSPDATIKEHLEFDALHVAGQMTGKSYKDDSETESLGIGLLIAANRNREQVLRKSGDTYMGMAFAEFLRVAEAEGFAILSQERIEGADYPDTFAILWKASEGLLMRAESYWGGESTSSASVYFNLETDGFPARGSGGLCDGAFIGDFDCREGLRYTLAEMRNQGRFLPRWRRRPFLWLLNYAESRTNQQDYRAINEQRIALLPEDVRRAITVPDAP